MQRNETAPEALHQLAAADARAVPGVAQVANSDVRLRRSRTESPCVDCTLTAYPDVQLHVVGAAVQLAIATALQRGAGVTVREINIYIRDIVERAEARPVKLGKNADHA
jgi:uncharacterized alkaline shock family protein YloU